MKKRKKCGLPLSLMMSQPLNWFYVPVIWKYIQVFEHALRKAPTHAMEGGVWGIVIIISAFMIQVLTFGTTASIGVYNIELLDNFPDSSIGVSLIGSINFGVYLGSGEFSLVNMYQPLHVYWCERACVGVHWFQDKCPCDLGLCWTSEWMWTYLSNCWCICECSSFAERFVSKSVRVWLWIVLK